MKLGISTYSFLRYVNEGRLDLFGVIKTVADMGFDGIEFSRFGPDIGIPPIELAKKVKDACGEAGLTIISWTIGADLLRNKLEDEIERLHTDVDIAAALGAPRMRHDATAGFPDRKNNLTDFIEALPIVAKGYREVTKYAVDKGVKTMIENHGFFFQDSDRIEALIETVDHPNFGTLVDIGNFLCADEDPKMAVTRVAPYAFHVHAKDFHVKSACSDPGEGWFKSRGGAWLRGSVIGHGNVDVKGCMKILKDSGYDDFLSIEFEGMEDNALAIKTGLDNLRRYSAEL